MQLEYILQVIDTGKILKKEKLPIKDVITLRRWQAKWQRKLLRYKRTLENDKRDIQSGNTIAGWSNFDEVLASGIDMPPLYEFIFKGYDNYFDSYYNKNNV